MTEPNLIHCTERITSGPCWIDIECRFRDGQKFVAIQVDDSFPALAQLVVKLLQQHLTETSNYRG